MSVVEEIGRAGYVSLTTYRKNGTGVATPVWHALHDGELFVVSNADAWKVRRIRNDARVSVTVCDVRGRVRPGAPTAAGTARLLDEAGTAAARGYVARKYFLSRAGNFLTRLLRLRRPPVVGIAIALRTP
ncbi:PPOX class F420-dependent oxidoreductase [Dactylosporangium sp. NPDC048998]|uniref:PPOX class F420-dependent oxidoreductase n=1 Tax=Dactylosporangium sp. NPDC048998 TaxID=3363976 RepID=UPI0037128B5D